MKLPEEIRRDPRIDLIPLLDCIFLLVVFFMYAMLFMVNQQGIPLNLPKVESSVASQGERIVLSVATDGQIYWNDHSVQVEELKELLKQETHSWLYVRADQNANYGLVAQVLSWIRQAQIQRVTLETDP